MLLLDVNVLVGAQRNDDSHRLRGNDVADAYYGALALEKGHRGHGGGGFARCSVQIIDPTA